MSAFNVKLSRKWEKKKKKVKEKKVKNKNLKPEKCYFKIKK